MFGSGDPSPRLPATPSEKLTAALFLGALLTLFAVDVATRAGDAAIGVLALFAAWLPLLVVHEAGHAVAAWLCGWRVSEIVIGHGPELTRFELGETLVRVKPLPVEGYVRPSPKRPGRARLKSAFVYFAGPGAEMLVLLALWGASGGELLTRDAAPHVVAMQGVAVAIGMSLVFNLVPWPWSRTVNDGLGIVLSLSTSEESFADRMVHPVLLHVRRLLFLEDTDGAAARIASESERLPPDPRLEAWRAACEAQRGDLVAADAMLAKLGSPDEHSVAVAAELRAARAWVDLASDDPGRLLHAVQEARLAHAAVPELHFLILIGCARAARGRDEEAYGTLVEAYRQASEVEEEGQCLAHLAIVGRRLVEAGRDPQRLPVLRPEHPQRFARALSPRHVGPELHARVREALATP